MQKAPDLFAGADPPRILFVLGKGGVGRSTVAAALGLRFAAAGERVLILEWAVEERIAPWFGEPPAGAAPRAIGPGLFVASFEVADALRRYFVDHLHLPRIHRRVIRARPVARLLDAAPGLAELFFLGELWWMTTLAEKEAGLAFDRIVVDAPATGHATSILDVPATVAAMHAGGLLRVELERVERMLADPARTGALVVALPESLVMAETLELVSRLGERLRRPPLSVVVNRSVAHLAAPSGWIEQAPLPSSSRVALQALADELRMSAAVEQDLRRRPTVPSVSLPELPGLPPGGVARALAGVA